MTVDETPVDRPDGTTGVVGNRAVSTHDGQFMAPADTAKAEWDLDPNADGDLVIPDDIEGRGAGEAPNVGAADLVSFLIESQDSQDLSLKLEWLDGPDGTVRATEDKNDSGLFGPDTTVRLNVWTAYPWVKVTVTSEAGAGTQNRVTVGMETH